jgi:hypothetical protein
VYEHIIFDEQPHWSALREPRSGKGLS